MLPRELVLRVIGAPPRAVDRSTPPDRTVVPSIVSEVFTTRRVSSAERQSARGWFVHCSQVTPSPLFIYHPMFVCLFYLNPPLWLRARAGCRAETPWKWQMLSCKNPS